MPRNQTPPAVRGQLYTTPLYSRCYHYQACRRCFMCTQYNKHSTMCQACEGAKPPGTHHKCTPNQMLGLVQLEEKFNRPLLDFNNMEPATVSVAETARDPAMQRATEMIRAKELL
jgi:hypothetical protein